MKNLKKRCISLVLAAAMAAGLTACGSQKKEDRQTDAGESYVWVASYAELEGSSDDVYYSDYCLRGDRIYYTCRTYGEESGVNTLTLCYRLISDMESAPVTVYQTEYRYDSEASQEEAAPQYQVIPSLVMPGEGETVYVVSMTMPIISSNDGETDWERMERETTYELTGIQNGEEQFCIDMTGYVRMDANSPYISSMIADGEGRIFLSNSSSFIWVFDADGVHITDVRLESEWFNSLILWPDGRAAYLDTTNQPQFRVYNDETKDFSEVYGNLPQNCWNASVAQSPSGTLYIYDGNTGIVIYDTENNTTKPYLDFLDCDVNPENLTGIMCPDDETVYALNYGWEKSELITLKRVPAEEVVQKETLVLGCFGVGSDIQSLVVAFNKENEQYRIQIKDYYQDIDWEQSNAYEQFLQMHQQMNNDLLVGNGPDLFAAGDVNLELLAVKGLIENLTPYLEKSQTLQRSELMEPILDAFTINGTLCAIPRTFYISTLVGRASELKSEPGWTVQEMIEYAGQYPEAQLVAYSSRNAILSMCLTYDLDFYVDLENGTCHFDSEEFKTILKLAAEYPEDVSYETTLPKLIGNHEVLLDAVSVSDLMDWQVEELMFGEPVMAIGFPGTLGSGVKADGYNGFCISSVSSHKEGAWAFIESLLTKESYDSIYGWGFPIRQDVFEEELTEAMTPQYQKDGNGNLVLDSDGNPIEISQNSYGWEDVTYDLYAASEEDAAQIRALIEAVDGSRIYDEQLYNIILEEAEPYFEGQKSLEEVVDIIQSRAKVYISENL